MKINPSAFVFWLFLSCIGFLIAGTITGAVAGLAVGTGLSFLVDTLSK